MPTIGSKVALGAPDESARLRNLRVVVNSIEGWGPTKEWPVRPAALELSDWDLCEALKRFQRGETLPGHERRQLRLFGLWKSAVLVVEERDRVKLWTLLSLLFLAEEKKKGKEAQTIRRFILARYRARVPAPCPSPDLVQASRWACHHSRNLGVLPRELRIMRVKRQEEPGDDSQLDLGEAEEL